MKLKLERGKALLDCSGESEMWDPRVPGRLAVRTATRVPTITPDGDRKGFKPPALVLS